MSTTVNRIKREAKEVGYTVNSFLTKQKKAFKNATTKLVGEEIWLSKVQKLQKRKLRELHKLAYVDQCQEEKKNAAISLLQSTAAALSGSENDSCDSSVLSAASINIKECKKWTAETKVKRSIFIKKISDYCSDALSKWETLSEKERKKLVLIKNGRKIHLLSESFFNDALHADDDEVISWVDFKEKVFYNYLKNISGNIERVKIEIKSLKRIKQAFADAAVDLAAEQAKDAKAKAKAKAKNGGDNSENKNAGSDSKESGKEDDDSKEEKVYSITYGNIRDRILKNKVDVSEVFWNLPCWDESNLSNTVTEEEFIQRYLDGKTVEDLELILQELVDEQRSGVDEKNLLLTSSDGKSNDNGDSYENEEDVENEENYSDSKNNGDNKGDGKSKPPSESKMQFFDDVKNITGIPKNFDSLYRKSSNELRIVLRKLVLLVRAKNLTDPLDVSTELYQSNWILSLKLKDDVELAIKRENQRYLKAIKQATKKKKCDESLIASIESEYKATESQLLESRDKLKVELAGLRSLLLANFRKYLKKAKSKDQNINQPLITNISSTRAFKIQLDSLDKFYDSKNSSCQDELPISLDYSSELNEPLKQACAEEKSDSDNNNNNNDNEDKKEKTDNENDHSFLYAIKLMKEWQDYNRTGKTDRLSLNYLKGLVADYNPNADEANLVDALELLSSYGIVTENDFNNFLNRSYKDTPKARAKLMTGAARHMIEQYLRVKNTDDLKVALYKYGPCLITLPVYDTAAEKFWVSTASPPQGYYTLLVTGYDDENNVFKLRNNLGKEWGNMGNTEIDYEDAFNSSQVVVCIDGGSRRG